MTTTELPKLLDKGKYKLKLKKLIQSAETFKDKTEAHKIWVVHYLNLVDDQGVEFPCQIANLSTTWVAANVGDIIEFEVKCFMAGKYHINFIRVAELGNKLPNARPNNPVVSGTAAAIALNLAVEYSKYSPDVNVLEKADIYFGWLVSKAI